MIPFDSNGYGGVGYSSIDNFGVDTTPPDPPIISSPANLSSTPNSWVELSGTAEPLTNGFDTIHVVRIYDNVSGPASIANFTMDGRTYDGWFLNVTGLADGPHRLTATVTDRANNTSPSSAATIVTVDATAPAVVFTNPSSDATEVSPDSNVTARFDEAIDPATVTFSTFTLTPANDPHTVSSVVNLAPDGQTAVLNPNSDLTGSTPYTAILKGGPGGVKDVSGRPIAGYYEWSFMTAPRSAVIERPLNNAQINTNTFVVSGTAQPESTVGVSPCPTCGEAGQTTSLANGQLVYVYNSF